MIIVADIGFSTNQEVPFIKRSKVTALYTYKSAWLYPRYMSFSLTIGKVISNFTPWNTLHKALHRAIHAETSTCTQS